MELTDFFNSNCPYYIELDSQGRWYPYSNEYKRIMLCNSDKKEIYFRFNNEFTESKILSIVKDESLIRRENGKINRIYITKGLPLDNDANTQIDYRRIMTKISEYLIK